MPGISSLVSEYPLAMGMRETCPQYCSMWRVFHTAGSLSCKLLSAMDRGVVLAVDDWSDANSVFSTCWGFFRLKSCWPIRKRRGRNIPYFSPCGPVLVHLNDTKYLVCFNTPLRVPHRSRTTAYRRAQRRCVRPPFACCCFLSHARCMDTILGQTFRDPVDRESATATPSISLKRDHPRPTLFPLSAIRPSGYDGSCRIRTPFRTKESRRRGFRR